MACWIHNKMENGGISDAIRFEGMCVRKYAVIMNHNDSLPESLRSGGMKQKHVVFWQLGENWKCIALTIPQLIQIVMRERRDMEHEFVPQKD